MRIRGGAKVPSTSVVINEVCTRGPGGTLDEFVELRNISAVAQNVGGWRLVVCNAIGTAVLLVTLPPNTVMQPKGQVGQCFLVANCAGYGGATPPDLCYFGDIQDLGGVKLLNPNLPPLLQKVDAVGFTLGLQCTETCPAEAQTAAEDPQGLCNSRDVDSTDTDLNCVDFRKLPRSPCNRFS